MEQTTPTRIKYEFITVILCFLDTISWGMLLEYNMDPVHGHRYNNWYIVGLWLLESGMIIYLGRKSMKGLKPYHKINEE